MSIPTWFDYEAYFQNKLATMAGYNELTLMKAFADAQYPYTAEGMYQHYVDHGQREGIAPNDLFNAEQYLYAKAAEWLNIAVDVVTPQHLKSLELQLEGANLTPLQHFQNHWSEYYATEGKFLNPSDNFNVQKYMEDKLAQMKAEDPAYTMQDLVNDFTAAGLDPITHYYNHGQEEGLTITPASASGKTIFLENDEAFGTIGNDSITAKLDVLNDHSYIDGGAGNDILMAYVSADTKAIRPEIYNVEKIILSQKQAPAKTGDNAVGEEVPVSLDAGKIQGMTMLVNADSRASLYVEDVRTLSTDMTIVWQDSDPGMNLNYGVYFDDVYLVSQAVQRSGTIRVELMDVKNSEALETHSLQDNVWNTISFDLVTASGTQTVTLTAATGYNGETATINTFFEALRTALNSSEWSDLITISLEAETYIGTASSAGNNWRFESGHRIVFETNSGTIDEASVNWSFGGESVVPGTGGIAWGVLGSETESCPLIQTNIHLDNVGRVLWDEASTCLPDERIWGSESGDMIVGGMGDRGGVERFDVTVDEGSWLSSLSSTNNTLRLVTVKNGVDAGFEIVPSEGPSVLFIGSSLKDNAAENVDQNLHSTPGSFTTLPFLLSTDGLVDVKHFDASDFNGTVNLGASITAESYAKYLKDVDGTAVITEDYAPNGSFNYLFGNSVDVLNMKINGGIAADNDFIMNINMGGGNDFVNLRFDDTITDQQVRNSAKLQNVQINGGDGNDTVWTWGNGAVTVTGGNGNDAIYVGQLDDEEYLGTGAGGDGIPGEQNAVWVFNTDLANREIFVTDVDGAQPMDNNFQALRSSTSVTSTGTEAGDSLYVTVNFKGFTATAVVANTALTANNGTASVSTLDINRAIISAIENDAVLSKVLAAGTDGAGYGLMIQALIDGEMTLADLLLTFDFRSALDDASKGTATLTDDSALGSYQTNFAEYADPAASVVTTDIALTLDNFVLGSSSHSTVDLLIENYANATMLEEDDVFSITLGGVTYSTTVTAAQAGAADVEAQLLLLLAAVDTAGDGTGTALTTVWTAAAGTIDDGTIVLESAVNDQADPATVSAAFDREVETAFVTGTDTGTQSINRVVLDAGNDVITLNAEADGTNDWLDTLVIKQEFGNDSVFNFTVGDDVIDVAAYAGATDARTFNDLNNTGIALTGTNTLLTEAQAATYADTLTGAGASWNGGGTAGYLSGILAIRIGTGATATNTWQFFSVANTNGDDTIAASEVKSLGTITFDDDAAAAVALANAGDIFA